MELAEHSGWGPRWPEGPCWMCCALGSLGSRSRSSGCAAGVLRSLPVPLSLSWGSPEEGPVPS